MHIRFTVYDDMFLKQVEHNCPCGRDDLLKFTTRTQIQLFPSYCVSKIAREFSRTYEERLELAL